tara:strand:- start:52 stop:765 length:714 start_codon:yes stop_codon:yes gene_type:complete
MVAKLDKVIAENYLYNGVVDNTHIDVFRAKKIDNYIFIQEKGSKTVDLYSLKNKYCEIETDWCAKYFDKSTKSWSKNELKKVLKFYIKSTCSITEYLNHIGYTYCLVSTGGDMSGYGMGDKHTVIPFKKESINVVKDYVLKRLEYELRCLPNYDFNNKITMRYFNKMLDSYHSLELLKIFKTKYDFRTSWQIRHIEELNDEENKILGKEYEIVDPENKKLKTHSYFELSEFAKYSPN